MAGEQVSVGFLDYSNEASTTGVNVGAVTAISLPGLLTQIAAFITAIDAITVGALKFDQLIAYKTNRTSIPPTDPQAQRERKWKVFYTDTTAFFDDPVNAIPNAGYGKIFSFEVPTAHFGLADVFPLNSDEADLTQTQVAAFVAAFEALGRSPYGGEVDVLKIVGVGRSI